MQRDVNRRGGSAEQRDGERAAAAHGERLDSDPGVSRSHGSGAAPYPGVGESQGGRLRGERDDGRSYGRGQHESGGHAPHWPDDRQGVGQSGYGGYGESPGEGAGGFDSGRNYAAEPGWGPGYGGHDPDRSGWLQAGGPGLRHRDSRHDPRSDERLREDICERLLQRDDIDASEVTVEAHDGVVKLEGAVPEGRMKHAIEDLVDACIGVAGIENGIRVTYGEHRSVHGEPVRRGGPAALSIGGAGAPGGSGGRSGGAGGE